MLSVGIWMSCFESWGYIAQLIAIIINQFYYMLDRIIKENINNADNVYKNLDEN